MLELQEQLHELERVEHAGLEKIGVRGRHLDVEALDEQGAKALDDGVGQRPFSLLTPPRRGVDHAIGPADDVIGRGCFDVRRAGVGA